MCRRHSLYAHAGWHASGSGGRIQLQVPWYVHMCACVYVVCVHVPLCCHSAAVYDIEKPPMTDRDCYRFKTDQKRQYLTQSHNQPITCLTSISGQRSSALAITCLASISGHRSPALAITCLASISGQRSPALAITCLTSISGQRSPSHIATEQHELFHSLLNLIVWGLCNHMRCSGTCDVAAHAM